MPSAFDKNDPEIIRTRLLKPSGHLYFLIVVGNLIVLILIAFLFLAAETAFWAILITLVFGLGFIWMFTEAITDWIAKRAEQSGAHPGVFYEVDVKREKRRYGPFRANRLFGQPIGKSEK